MGRDGKKGRDGGERETEDEMEEGHGENWTGGMSERKDRADTNKN